MIGVPCKVMVTLLVLVTNVSGRALVMKSDHMDNQLNELVIVPMQTLHVRGRQTERTNNGKTNMMSDNSDAIRSHSSHNSRHRDTYTQQLAPAYRSFSKDQTEKQKYVLEKASVRNHYKSQTITENKVDERDHVSNNNLRNVTWQLNRHHKKVRAGTRFHRKQKGELRRSRPQIVHREKDIVPNGNDNVFGNNANLSLSHKWADSSDPNERYKQSTLSQKVELERQPNVFYEDEQQHKSETNVIDMASVSSTVHSINLHNEASQRVDDDTEDDVPSFDIPNRFLKIPSSEKKLQSLIREVSVRHPCFKNVPEDNGGKLNKLNLSRKYGADNIMNNINKLGEKIKLCKLQNRTVSKRPRHSGRHKRKHNKATQMFHGKSPFQGTIYQDKQLSLVNETYKDSQIQSQPQTEGLSNSRTNWVDTTKGKDESEGRNLITLSSANFRKTPQKQQITSMEGKEQTFNFTQQFNTARPLTNSTFRQDYTRKSGDLIIWCSGETKDAVWTSERINRLLRKIIFKTECWHASALEEIYQLEGHLHGTENGGMAERDSNGVSEVICYLIEETEKCLYSGNQRTSSNEVSSKEHGDKVSESTSKALSTGISSTTTQQTITSPQYEKSKMITKSQKHTLNDKLNRFDQSNYFNFDWEANMLFY